MVDGNWSSPPLDGTVDQSAVDACGLADGAAGNVRRWAYRTALRPSPATPRGSGQRSIREERNGVKDSEWALRRGSRQLLPSSAVLEASESMTARHWHTSAKIWACPLDCHGSPSRDSGFPPARHQERREGGGRVYGVYLI
jgi:hypothetical protein